MNKSRERLRDQYLGTLGLLAECSVYLHGPEAEEHRQLIEDALSDAEKMIPGFRWRRILNVFVIELTEASPDATSEPKKLEWSS